MEKIAIITDSCADVPKEYVDKYNIYVMPMVVQCEDKEYKDGIDIKADDVYEMQKDKLLRTSTPTGDDVIGTLEMVKNDGYNKAIAVLLSSGLSGTYNQVRLLSQDIDGLEIEVINGKSGSLGYGLIAIALADYRDNGASFEELKEMGYYFADNSFAYFAIDTLEHLARGGRIGKATAFVGGIMKIKPILSFDKENGEIFVPAKMRGRKGLQDKIVELIGTKIKEYPDKKFTIGVVQGGIPEEGNQLVEALKSEFPNIEKCYISELGAALSTYLGFGLLGCGIIFHK